MPQYASCQTFITRTVCFLILVPGRRPKSTMGNWQLQSLLFMATTIGRLQKRDLKVETCWTPKNILSCKILVIFPFWKRQKNLQILLNLEDKFLNPLFNLITAKIYSYTSGLMDVSFWAVIGTNWNDRNDKENGKSSMRSVARGLKISCHSCHLCRIQNIKWMQSVIS